jgi:hypothetical protein
MNSLFELKEFFLSHEIKVSSYDGITLTVGDDCWGLAHGVFYCNNTPAKPKDPLLIEQYKKIKEPVKTTMWKGIKARNYNLEE